LVVVVVVVVLFVAVPLVRSLVDELVVVVVAVEFSDELLAAVLLPQAARLAAARTATEASAKLRTCVMVGVSRFANAKPWELKAKVTGAELSPRRCNVNRETLVSSLDLPVRLG
jgi:hypothetical protein